MNKIIRIGSRQSPLAKVQVNEVIQLLKKHGLALTFQQEFYQTAGDKDKVISLTHDSVQDNFFTDALDQALLRGEIDLAIHSAKDLPQQMPKGVIVAALTQALDETDAFVGRYRLIDMPVGSVIGTSSLVREAGIKKINPQVRCQSIRGTIEERLQQLDRQDVDGLIIATCALKRLGLENRIKEILPWPTTPLQGQLAVTVRKDDWEIQKICQTIDVRRRYGLVTLVGAGPGDPHLLTRLGQKALAQADVVVYDYLVNESLLALAGKAKHIFAGKRKGCHSISQDDLNALLRSLALEYRYIVRLKGGDPLIFGRGADEMAYLRAYHVPMHVIPGISSATGIPSHLGVPLTARSLSKSVSFLTGHKEDDAATTKPIILPQTDSLVFLMGLTKLDEIVQSLLTSGRTQDEPIIIISKGTCVDEVVIQSTLGQIKEVVKEKKIEQPALIIVSPTLKAFPWDNRPKWLFLGTHHEAYGHLGQIIAHPMINPVSCLTTSESQQKCLDEIKHGELIIFTSVATVKTLDELFKSKNLDWHMLDNKVIVAIGETTEKAINARGKMVDLRPRLESAQGIYDLLKKLMPLRNRSIFIPRSNKPNPFLAEALGLEGAKVSVMTVYENQPVSRRELPHGEFQGVIVTSPSALDYFIQQHGPLNPRWQIIAKGKFTKNAIEQRGYLCHFVLDD